METKRKGRTEHEGACRTAETAEKKYHRLSKPRTKDKARNANAPIEVVSCTHTQIIAQEL